MMDIFVHRPTSFPVNESHVQIKEVDKGYYQGFMIN